MRTNCGARNTFLVLFPIIISILTIHNCGIRGQIDDAAEYPEVEILQGKLRGVNFTTYRKRVVYAFKGIPFAQPPVGNLRFRDPLPASAWKGTFDASKDADMCPQLYKGRIVGDEDCLYLNVYTPHLPTTNKKLLPVMVWIHGGGFANGSGISTETDPTYVMDRDVILVSPNYRLGLLGCLSTGDHVAPGNYGMKDKVLVLKWVRDNIIHFGGDSDRVTILGISSGGASVNLLAISDLANGLFHRYVQMSGSALAPWAFAPRSTLARHSYRFGGYINCPTNTSVSLIDCLREFNASYILGMATLFEWNSNYRGLIWTPTDELEAEGAFLTDSPANFYNEGKIKDLPFISGVVREDGLWSSRHFYNDNNAFDDFLKNIDDDLPSMLLYEDRGDAAARTAALKSYYLNDLSENRNLLLDNLTELMSDTFYFYPAYNAHRRQFSLGQSPQYLYSFEYKGSFQLRHDASAHTDIEHADEECFLFPIREFCCKRGLSDCEISETDSKMIDVMVDLWTSFSTNGTPTVSSTHVAVNWEPYSTEDNYLRIGNGLDAAVEMKKYFFRDRMRFWNDRSLGTLNSKTTIVDLNNFCSTTDHEPSNLTTFQSQL